MAQPQYIQDIIDKHAQDGLPENLRTGDPAYDAALAMIVERPTIVRGDGIGEGKQLFINIDELRGTSKRDPQPEQARDKLGLVLDAVYALLAKHNVKFPHHLMNITPPHSTSDPLHASKSVSYNSESVDSHSYSPGRAKVHVHLADDQERDKANAILIALADHNLQRNIDKESQAKSS